MPNKYLDSVGLAEYTTLIKTALDDKADLASPALTGTPTAPTPTAGDNSTKVATTAFVNTKAGNYLPLTGGSITGNLSVSGTITGNVNGNVTGNVTGTASGNLPLSGGTMTGGITTSGFPAIKHTNSTSNITIVGGSSTGAADGAKLILNGGSASTDPGNFTVQAGTTGSYKQLVGNPNGSLTWGGSNVAVTGTLQNGHGILSGSVSDISIAAKGYTSGSVSFGQTFAAAPAVVAVCAYGHAHVYVGCHGITTTGFNYIVSSENASAFSNEKISWIAIG